MAIDAELRAFLLSRPNIEAEVDTRVSPGSLLPQSRSELTDKMPAIVFGDLEDTPHYHIDCGVTLYSRIRYRIVAWGNSLHDARRVSNAIKGHLDGFCGNMAQKEIGFSERRTTSSRFVPGFKLWRVTSDYSLHVMNGG